jgi:HK97 gp10 family phage protein
MATVVGLERLQKKLRAMPERARLRIREALEKGASEVVRAQKALSAKSHRTGNLAESDHWEDGDHQLQLRVVNDAFYAMHVEFGTSHSAAEPFFFPGYRLSRKRVKGRVKRAVNAAVKEAANAGG